MLPRVLELQLKKLGLTVDSPPSNPKLWREFLSRITDSYKKQNKNVDELKHIFLTDEKELEKKNRELDRALTELTQSEERLKLLVEFKSQTEELFDIDSLIKLTIEKAVDIHEIVTGHLALLDYTTGYLAIHFFSILGSNIQVDKHIVDDDGITRRIIEYGKSIQCNNKDIASNLNLSKFYPSNVQTLLSVPIKAHTTVLGTLSVGKTLHHSIGKSDKRLLETLAGQVACALERIRLISALRNISEIEANAMDMNRLLDSILDDVTETYRFDYAIIWLIDEYRNVIEMVKGRNIPLRSYKKVEHDLDQSDVLVEIIRNKQPILTLGWDERFNATTTREKNQYDKLSCLFAPISNDTCVVGVIETGCKKISKDGRPTCEHKEKISEIGVNIGPLIARARIYSLLELIASQAINIIGADSACIRIYRDDEEILGATAGKANEEFLRKFNPRDDGIGQKAMNSGHPITIGSSEMQKKEIELYKKGVRAYAAFPLAFKDVKGILYIHFWYKIHEFSKAEIGLENAFVQQIVIVIKNYLDIKRELMDTAEKAAEGERTNTINILSALFAHRLSNVSGTIPIILNDIRKQVKNLGISDLKLDQRINHLESDVSGLLKIAKQFEVPQEVGKIEPTRIKPVIDRSIMACRPRLKRTRIIFKQEIDESCKVLGVESYLTEIFINLIQNATEANAKKITISMKLSALSNELEVSVKDDGDGIKESDLNKIFMPLYTKKSNDKTGKIHGKGLWISHKMISKMKGRIDAKSKLGHGSVFSTTLKLAE